MAILLSVIFCSLLVKTALSIHESARERERRVVEAERDTYMDRDLQWRRLADNLQKIPFQVYQSAFSEVLKFSDQARKARPVGAAPIVHADGSPDSGLAEKIAKAVSGASLFDDESREPDPKSEHVIEDYGASRF